MACSDSCTHDAQTLSSSPNVSPLLKVVGTTLTDATSRACTPSPSPGFDHPTNIPGTTPGIHNRGRIGPSPISVLVRGEIPRSLSPRVVLIPMQKCTDARDTSSNVACQPWCRATACLQITLARMFNSRFDPQHRVSLKPTTCYHTLPV